MSGCTFKNRTSSVSVIFNAPLFKRSRIDAYPYGDTSISGTFHNFLDLELVAYVAWVYSELVYSGIYATQCEPVVEVYVGD